MDTTAIILVGSLMVFLYVLHVLVSDDFVLLRKNVAIEKIFDLAFVTIFFGMFGARLSYVFSDYDPAFLNPLVFLLFTYFPGLTLAGGIVFSIATIFFFAKRQKYPVGRIFDLFSLAALPGVALGIGLYGQYVLAVLFFALFFILLQQFYKHGMKDGSVAAIAILSFSFVLLIARFVMFFKEPEKLIRLETFLILLLLTSSVLFLLRHEKLVRFR